MVSGIESPWSWTSGKSPRVVLLFSIGGGIAGDKDEGKTALACVSDSGGCSVGVRARTGMMIVVVVVVVVRDLILADRKSEINNVRAT